MHSCGLQVTLGHSSVMPDGCVYKFIAAVKYNYACAYTTALRVLHDRLDSVTMKH